MRVLIIGFGPFESVTSNPSQRVVEHFAKIGLPGNELTTRVLRVSYAEAAAEVPNLIARHRPEVAVLLGVDKRADRLKLERLAYNRTGRADVDGFVPESGSLREGGPASYESNCNIEHLVGRLNLAGVPANPSDSAGTYLCNGAYYWALHTIAEESLATLCVFLHIPPDDLTPPAPDVNPTPLQRTVDGVRIVLDDLVKPR